MICRCIEDGQVILKGGKIRYVRVGWEGDIELNDGNKVPPNMEKVDTKKKSSADVDKL